MVVLPRAGGAGDQHHAVGFLDVAAEAAQIDLVEPDDVERELFELLAHRLFVEDAEHGIFAVDGGHDGDTEVDGAAVVLDAETAILGDAALGNVELAHDLDARDDGRVMLFADGRHGVGEHAVDAELDDDRVVARLDVNVAGAALERGENRGIDEADDRAHVRAGGGRQLVDGDGFVVAGLVLADDVEGKTFARVFEHALGLLGFLQDVGDLREGGNLGDDALAEQQADLVDHHELAGIGDGDGEAAVGRLVEGNEFVAEHQVDGNFFEQVVVQLEVAEIDELATIAARNVARALQFVGNRRRRFRHQLAAIHHRCLFVRHCHVQFTFRSRFQSFKIRFQGFKVSKFQRCADCALRF